MSSIQIAGDTSGSITLSAPAVAGTNTITLPAVTGTILTTAYTGNVTFSGNLIVGADTLYVDSTNNKVGIGTSSPVSRLHISAGTNALRTITLEDSASGATSEIMSTASGGLPSLAFKTAGTERMRIDSNGYVGIGTSSPINGLTVQTSGTQWIGSTVNTYAVPAGNVFIQAKGSINQDNWIGITGVYGGTSGSSNILLQANLNNVSQQAGHYIGSQAISATSSDLTFGKMVGGAVTTTTNATKSEHMRITSTGNVGIGTNSPLAILDVASSTTACRIRNTTGSSAYILFQNSDSGTTTSDGLYVGLGAGEEGYMWNYENDNLLFGTNNTERMRIDTSGNVGIGTSSPSYKLDANSSGNYIARFQNSTNQPLFIYSAANLSGIVAESNGQNGLFFNSSSFYGSIYTSGQERMRITSTGNVGIGTSSPSEKLEVIGAAYVGQANLSKGMYLSSIGSIELIRDDSLSYIDFKTTAAEDFDCRIQTSSNGLNFYVGGDGSTFARLQLASDGGVYLPSAISNGFGKSTFVVEDGANTGEEGGVEIRAFAPRLLLVDRSTGAYTVNMVMDGVNFSWYENTDANRYTTKGTERFRYGITTGTAYNTTGTWGTISDQKLKENIVDATPKLDEVKQLQVRNFNLIGEDFKQIGFVAQEIEQVFPNIVDTQVNEEDDTETKYVKTTVLIPILTKAIQELSAKVDALQTEINVLKGE